MSLTTFAELCSLFIKSWDVALPNVFIKTLWNMNFKKGISLTNAKS